MKYLHVGMVQGAVLPRPCDGYTGVSTHGIDSCTGLAIVSEDHVFLAHMPPPPNAENWDKMLEWRKRYMDLLAKALPKMKGDIKEAVIISPNAKLELPNGGPTLIAGTVNTVYGIATVRELGTAVTVNARTGEVAVKTRGLDKDEYTECPGGTDNNWVLIN